MIEQPTSVHDYESALEFLDARIGQGVKPGLDRIAGLLALMGDPQESYPVIHVAGTNGKTTTVRMVRDILGAHGLLMGSFVSPHLHTIEERYSIAGAPLGPDQFVAAVADVAPFVEIFEATHGESITYFELTAAVAFAAFAAAAVDVAVVEVGLGGRLDATNVVQAEVSVITGVAMDHMSYLGDSISEIAGEKVAILKEDGLLVTGPLDAAAEGAVTARVAETSSKWFRRGDAYDVTDVRQAHGGWVATIEGIEATYDDIVLPLHGEHQLDHLGTAVAATEVFFDRALDGEAVRLAAEELTSPGRIEIAARQPLVVIDGAHNRQSMEGLARALDREFPHESWVLVVGIRGDRDIPDLLEPLVGHVASVVATAADDPAAVPAEEVADAVITMGPSVPCVTAPTVKAAVAQAAALAGADGAVVVAGSLYVAGEAREALGLTGLGVSKVHQRIAAMETDDEPEAEADDWDAYVSDSD